MKNALAVLLSLSCLGAYADTLRVNNESLKGVFMKFEKNKFHFQGSRDEKAVAYEAMQVSRLKIDEPVNVKYSLGSAPKKKQTGKLKGYSKKGFFIMVTEQGEEQISRTKIMRMTAVMDMAECMRRFQAVEAEQPQEADEGKKAETLIVKGKPTILHFHDSESHASRRQGNLASRLANDSRGKLEYVKVTVKSVEAPTAKVNGVATLPQFWFYNRNGELLQKLCEQFTEELIEDAVKRACK